VAGQDLLVEMSSELWLVEDGWPENDVWISFRILSVRSLYSRSWRLSGPELRETRPLKSSQSSRNVTGSDSILVKDSISVLLP